MLRFCSVRPNADPCVSSDTEHFDWALLEVESSNAGKDYASPREEQLSFERDKYETWTDTAATPLEGESRGNEIHIAIMGLTGCGKSSFIEAYSSMKAIVEMSDLPNLRR